MDVLTCLVVPKPGSFSYLTERIKSQVSAMFEFKRPALKRSFASCILCYWLFLVCSQRMIFALDGTSSQLPSTLAVENIHYGILLDAGSSSTKSKIYRWTTPSSADTVPDVHLVRTSRYPPALTSFTNNEKDLTSYLMRILTALKLKVPEDEHSSTPISIMATAGLRFMSGPAVQSLLQLTRSIMSNTSINPFQFSETNGVSVLSGEEEGVYSWIAANYLHGFFDETKDVKETVGVLEMGGGSTQITFVPKGPLYAEEFHVSVAGKRYNLYVQSYLQFGINGIKVKVAHHLYTASSGSHTLSNPCMLRDDVSVVRLEEDQMIVLTLNGTGDPAECERILTLILKPNTGNDCQPKPCAIGSVYQPELPNITFYATQAFTYAPKNLKAVGSNKILDIDRLKEAASHHCNRTLKEAEESNVDKKYASDDCVTALYMTVLLTTSYGFPKNTSDIKVTSKIGGQYIDWALGAMLMEISSKLTEDKTQYSVTCKPERIKDRNFSASSFSLNAAFIIFSSVLTSFLLTLKDTCR